MNYRAVIFFLFFFSSLIIPIFSHALITHDPGDYVLAKQYDGKIDMNTRKIYFKEKSFNQQNEEEAEKEAIERVIEELRTQPEQPLPHIPN